MEWDDLTDGQKQTLVRQLLIGVEKNAENTNRARLALAEHPFLLKKMLKEVESEKGFERYKDDEEDGSDAEPKEDDSGFDLGLQKDHEAEVD